MCNFPIMTTCRQTAAHVQVNFPKFSMMHIHVQSAMQSFEALGSSQLIDAKLANLVGCGADKLQICIVSSMQVAYRTWVSKVMNARIVTKHVNVRWM